jgi:hypothetical protein
VWVREQGWTSRGDSCWLKVYRSRTTAGWISIGSLQ